MRELHKFDHGVGDCVQFTAVLKHLRDKDPTREMDVLAPLGKHSCFYGVADNAYYKMPDKSYDVVRSYSWEPPFYPVGNNFPVTKTVKCIIHSTKSAVNPNLLRYTIKVSDPVQEKVDNYLKEIKTERGIVGIHYQGVSERHLKDLPDKLVNNICKYLVSKGFTPLIFDWDKRCGFIDNQKVYCFDRKHPIWGGINTGDVETIAAIINRNKLLLAIVSGMLYIGMASKTPTIGIYTKYHPLYYVDYSDALHLIPENDKAWIRGNEEEKLRLAGLFYINYKYQKYKNLEESLIENIDKIS